MPSGKAVKASYLPNAASATRKSYLDSAGSFRLPHQQYPDLQKALPLIIQKASGVQPKPPRKKLSYSLSLGTIEKYVSFEEVINPSKSKGLFFAIADNGNHFTKYGIQEGSLMVFDRECGQTDDFPCCYIDETSKKMKLLRTAAEPDQYVGRLVAVLNTFQV